MGNRPYHYYYYYYYCLFLVLSLLYYFYYCYVKSYDEWWEFKSGSISIQDFTNTLKYPSEKTRHSWICLIRKWSSLKIRRDQRKESRIYMRPTQLTGKVCCSFNLTWLLNSSTWSDIACDTILDGWIYFQSCMGKHGSLHVYCRSLCQTASRWLATWFIKDRKRIDIYIYIVNRKELC